MQRELKLLVVSAALLAAVGDGRVARAQNCPLTDFTKTVENISNPGGPARRGDILEYTLAWCNNSASACQIIGMLDSWDDHLALSGIPVADLNRVNVPGTVGCPTDGGALCRKGMKGSMPGTWVTASTITCGQDCNAPSDDSNWIPNPVDPTARELQPNQCFFWTLRAMLSTTATSPACYCNQAAGQVCQNPGDPACLGFTEDPNWVSHDQGPSSPPGCRDTQTMRVDRQGRAGTCVEINPNPMIAGSKTVDALMKSPGDAVRYTISIHNSGAGNANNVSMDDLLTAIMATQSQTACLDTSQITLGPVMCNFDPTCGPPDYSVNLAGGQVTGSFVTIPGTDNHAGGGTVSFTIDSFVCSAAVCGTDPAGDCVNNWELRHIQGGQQVTDPAAPGVFNVGGAPVPDLRINKVANPTNANTNSPVTFTITLRNVGTAPIQNVQLVDAMQQCFDPPLGANGAICGTNLTCTGAGCTPRNPNCTYSNGGYGFTWTGLALAANDNNPGGQDEIAVVVNAITGSMNGACTNTASTPSDPDPDVEESTATVNIGGTPGPDLVIEKVLSAGQPGNVPPGATVDFDITVRNIGSGPVSGGMLNDVLDACFNPLGTSGQTCGTNVQCTSGATCAGATCRYTANGFNFNGWNLAANDGNPGGLDEITFHITAQAGTIPGLCRNTGSVIDGGTTESDSAEVTISTTQLQFTKTATPGAVAVGGTAEWTITIDNPVGAGDLANCTVRDNVNGGGCMTLDSGTCVSTPAQPTQCGVPTGEVSMGAFALPAGATQELRFMVTGDTAGNCSNTATLSCDGFPVPLQAVGSLQVGTSGCSINRADGTTPGGGLWVYTTSCPPGDNHLDNTDQLAATDMSDIDSLGGSTFTLYQWDCDVTCPAAPARLGLAKNGTMVYYQQF